MPHNAWLSWLVHAWQCKILTINIFNYIIVKIIKSWYFENNHRDESNNNLYANIFFYLLVEKYGQIKMCEYSYYATINRVTQFGTGKY
jgi:hypothetical protein